MRFFLDVFFIFYSLYVVLALSHVLDIAKSVQCGGFCVVNNFFFSSSLLKFYCRTFFFLFGKDISLWCGVECIFFSFFSFNNCEMEKKTGWCLLFTQLASLVYGKIFFQWFQFNFNIQRVDISNFKLRKLFFSSISIVSKVSCSTT